MDDTKIIKSVSEDVVEGEVEETDAAMGSTHSINSGQASSPQAVSLSLENLIRGHLSTLTRLKTEISEHMDTLNNILENDPTYNLHSEEAKKATKVKTATKAEIMKRPEVLQVANKIKSARQEYKDQQTTLSELLAEYQRTTGLDSIETEDGKVKKIVMTARLSG